MIRSFRHHVLIPLGATLAFLLGRLPTRALVVLGHAVGRLAWRVAPRDRALAIENVGRAFPRATGRECNELARAAYLHLGEVFADLLASLHARRVLPPVVLTDEGKRVFEEAIAKGRGVVLVSAHLGPWERVAHAIRNADLPLTAVVRAPSHRPLARLLETIRGSLPTIDRDRPGAALSMLRTLRRGDILGIPMDLATRSVSIDALFFDAAAPTAVGPAKLALRTGAALVAASAVRDTASGRIRVTCTHIDTDRSQGPSAMTEAINAELCARIRAYPEGWLWMHPRFSKPSPSA